MEHGRRRGGGAGVMRARRPLFAFLLVLALLAAQGLGLAHRVAHGAPLLAGGPGGAGAAVASLPDDGRALGFDSPHEPGTAECRLVDQTAHADALPVAALPALPPRVPAPLPVRLDAQDGEARTQAPLARGPPAFALQAAGSFGLTV